MNSFVKSRLIRIIIIVEVAILFFSLTLTLVYQNKKMYNKAQIFRDASRNDILFGDKRSLQTKIQLAIQGHEFSAIQVKDLGSANQSSTGPTILISEFELPVLSNTQDIKSKVGGIVFVYNRVSAVLEAFVIWLIFSSILLFVIPKIKETIELQVLTKMEQDKLRALAQMALKVAHDIRSPLSALQLASNLPDLNREEVRDLLKATAVRINSIAQDLVEDAKRKEKLFAVVDLKKVIHEILREKSIEFANQSSVNIQATGITADIYCECDENELKSIISNLINNSVEARNTERVDIFLRADVESDYCRITVEDNGTGMSKEMLQQLGKGKINSRKTGDSGSGIGLLNAYKSIKSMGGKIEVSSEVGKGSRFCIYLKRVQ